MPQGWYSGNQGPRSFTGFYFSRLSGGTFNGGTRPAQGLKLAGASRQPVSVTATGADAWDNIQIVDFTNDRSTDQASLVGVDVYWEDNGTKDATISTGLDTDANPYNGVYGPALYSRSTASLQGNYVESSLNMSGVAPGIYYVYAKITNGTHTRYYYAQGKLTVMAIPDPGAPVVTIVSPTSGSTWPTSSDRVFLHGTASGNVTAVTWANARTGENGNATGTSFWDTSRISLDAGANYITVTAIDASGRSGSDSITVTRDDSSRDTTLSATESAYVASGYPNQNLRDSFIFVGYDSRTPDIEHLKMSAFSVRTPPGWHSAAATGSPEKRFAFD